MGTLSSLLGFSKKKKKQLVSSKHVDQGGNGESASKMEVSLKKSTHGSEIEVGYT
jgi:hypothetical protein